MQCWSRVRPHTCLLRWNREIPALYFTCKHGACLFDEGISFGN
jgi:hypothetical protein